MYQNQWYRQCRTHRKTSHVLRDDGKFLNRWLFPRWGDPVGVWTSHFGGIFWFRPEEAFCDILSGWSSDSWSLGQMRYSGREYGSFWEQLLGDRRRTMRPWHWDQLRPRWKIWSSGIRFRAFEERLRQRSLHRTLEHCLLTVQLNAWSREKRLQTAPAEEYRYWCWFRETRLHHAGDRD